MFWIKNDTPIEVISGMRRGASQRPVRNPFRDDGGDGGADDRDEHGDQDREEEVVLPNAGFEEFVEVIMPVIAPTMKTSPGRIDEPEHAVDHRVAQGDQPYMPP